MKLKQNTTLNEQDSLQDMLDTEKRLLGLYAIACREGGTKELRKEFSEHFRLVGEDQFALFEQMSNRGYYQVEEAAGSAIAAAYARFAKRKKDLAN